MAIHLLRFVDSIAASPTTRLDVNDGTIFTTVDFDAPPPRLRRAMSQNAMSDGGLVSSSQYDMRIVKVTLLLNRSTQDLNATQLQLLGRELDRADNFLMFQPNGLTKPVFFVTKRSDFTSVREVPSPDAAVRAMEFEVLCEPFALGLRETLGPYTVNNDPAAGSNGCYFDVTGVIGDVASPCVLVNSTRQAGGLLAVRQHGTPSNLVFFTQAESTTLGTDTTNPGGGPDAAMSGTGTNNFARTSFATASMQTRLTWVDGGLTDAQRVALRGTYRLYAIVRRSDATSVMTAKCINSTASGETVTIPADTIRQLVNLGTISFGGGRERIGVIADANPVSFGGIAIQAARASGTGTLDWDDVLLIPADEQMLLWESSSTSTGFDTVLDGYNHEARYYTDGADIFAGTGNAQEPVLPAAGGFPLLTPGLTNRFFHIGGGAFSGGIFPVTNSESSAFTVHYWPQYLYVRPSAT